MGHHLCFFKNQFNEVVDEKVELALIVRIQNVMKVVNSNEMSILVVLRILFIPIQIVFLLHSFCFQVTITEVSIHTYYIALMLRAYMQIKMIMWS